MSVRAKKHLGQHFLRDAKKSKQIVSFLNPDSKNILEIGPGKGILTQFLFQRKDANVKVIEIDDEAVWHLEKLFPERRNSIIQDRKSTRLNSSHVSESRMPSSA